ncbi:MAG: type II toxin-antitoxin system VapC family toxin [Gammaproteobacteria bacterium]|nr:type II toxin-antitoxin system VapC family toxin [Gammaproteobacteria bacterium]NNJ84053.1 type II toxin-antitoxin system VapC family toxin [Gammaproteobacteria bacterium]
MKAVLDTNLVIYLQKGLLADNLPSGEYLISVITEMELFSFPGLNDEQQAWLRRFIDDIEVIGIHEKIKQRAIALRREYRLKLPDAIIAATAITHDAVLFSNDQGFAGLSGLKWQGIELCQGTARGKRYESSA